MINRKECRYCLSDDRAEKLIDPCNCEGTMKYVHKDCLGDWIKNSKREVYLDKVKNYFVTKCEICNYQIRYKKSFKYSIFKSLIKLIKTTFGTSKNCLIFLIHCLVVFFLYKRSKLFIFEMLEVFKSKFRVSVLFNVAHNASVLLSILLGINDIYMFYNKLFIEKRKLLVEFLPKQ
jgi:E3 ubiquitin-protein ligase DOA10